MLDIRMQYLNNCAGKMVKECRDGILKSGETAKSFFKYANKNDAHSQALVAYYSQIRNTPKVNIAQVYDRIELDARKSICLERHLGLFARKLEQKYPKTLNARLAIASNGGVVPSTVKTKNKFRKMAILMEMGYNNMKQRFYNLLRGRQCL